jgi:pilus assembly protein Flp/PilA
MVMFVVNISQNEAYAENVFNKIMDRIAQQACEDSRRKEDILIMKKFFMNEEGQGMVEYGLIIALVAVVVIGAITLLSGGIQGVFGKATTALNGE